MRSAWLLVVVGGCFGDKAIDMSLVPPTPDVQAAFNTSCTTAVEIYLDGTNYPGDENDYLRTCYDLGANVKKDTFDDIKAAIAGKFDVKMPASGLSGVEIAGYTGACNAPRERDYDLTFYAEEPYIGGDTMSLRMVPNLSCEPATVTVHPIDILKLVAKKDCAQAAWTTGKLSLSTLSPYPFSNETYWWGGVSAANPTTGTVSLRGNTKVGPNTCLAIGLFTSDWVQVACVPPKDQQVCATASEIEAPMISMDVWNVSHDPVKFTKWSSVVVGAVMSGTNPVAGATITIDDADKDKGEIGFYDMPPGVENGTGALTVTQGPATGPQGLFAVYTKSVIHISVTAGGKTVKRTIAGNQEDASAVFVKM